MIENSGYKNLRIRLKWLSTFRLAIATSLLTGIFIFQPGKDSTEGSSLAYTVALWIACSHLGVAILLFWKRAHYRLVPIRLLAYINIFWDISFASAMIYLSNVMDGKFVLLYFLTIFNAAFLLFTVGAYIAWALSSLGYALVLYALFIEKLPSLFGISLQARGWTEKDVLLSILAKSFLFLMTAGFSALVAKTYRKNEEAIEESKTEIRFLEQKLKSILDHIEDGVITVDEAGKIHYHNQSVLEIFAMSAEKMRGHTLFELFPELSPKVLEKNSFELTTKYGVHDTKVFTFTVVNFRQSQDAPLTKFILVKDLTEMRQMERKIKKTEQLAFVGEMAARMAHEIRNPLTSVSGAIEMLELQKHTEQDSSRIMRIVRNETDRLNQLLTDFLTFAKPNAGESHEVELSRIVQDAVDLFSASCPSKKISIDLNIDPGITFYGDAKSLTQMVWNFLNNSLEAMDSEGVLGLHLTTDEIGNIILTIQDSGKGIPSEVLPKIFNPFFSTKPKGTGLGLSVVHRIIEDHSGQVEVESHVGKGTKFVITFNQRGRHA